jgi:hypothetical protein
MSIQGKVLEYWSGRPVSGAIVSAGGRTAVTDSAGMFSLEVPLGVVSMSVTHGDFHPFVTSLNITSPRPFNIGVIKLQSKVRAL